MHILFATQVVVTYLNLVYCPWRSRGPKYSFSFFNSSSKCCLRNLASCTLYLGINLVSNFYVWMESNNTLQLMTPLRRSHQLQKWKKKDCIIVLTLSHGSLLVSCNSMYFGNFLFLCLFTRFPLIKSVRLIKGQWFPLASVIRGEKIDNQRRKIICPKLRNHLEVAMESGFIEFKVALSYFNLCGRHRWHYLCIYKASQGKYSDNIL